MSGETEDWKGVIDEEIDSLHKNSIWELVNLLTGKKVIRCKWVSLRKMIFFLQGVRYKIRLVTKKLRSAGMN